MEIREGQKTTLRRRQRWDAEMAAARLKAVPSHGDFGKGMNG
jgi:hypothetical protein